MNDLMKFCGRHLNPYYGMYNKFDIMLRRHFSIANKSEEKMINLIRLNFHRNIENNASRKIIFLLGLFTPEERTQFINKFIIIDDVF
jgi:hypothetical protein